MAMCIGKFHYGLLFLSLLIFISGNNFSNSFSLEEVVPEKFAALHSVLHPLDINGRNSVLGIEHSFLSGDNSLSCEGVLKGVGSLNTTCQLNTSLVFHTDISISGQGNLQILSHVTVKCPVAGCQISINISGDLKLGQHASVVAGTIIVDAQNVSLEDSSTLNTTALGGPPPEQTSGTPHGVEGAGGGHGGRGASCVKGKGDNWGGDVYAWSSLNKPWIFGSRGGTTSIDKDLGGGGGGRIIILAKGIVDVNGTISAEGGNAGSNGGGGSGGSIIIHSSKLKGIGSVSASGGTGFAGGGGGRIAIDCYSKQESVKIMVHGGSSIGCPGNAGAAGTKFDTVLRSLIVSNDNRSTLTGTPLLDFPAYPLWTNFYVESHAKVVVPLYWGRVQVYGALRMSVKMLLMWNSKLEIDGGGDTMVGTSLLEASNLMVLREQSVITSNANLGVHGQGRLNLTGEGDTIRGQRLFLSLFYVIYVGVGSILKAPLDEEPRSDLTPKLHCESETCPNDLIYPPEDCNVNASLPFTLQICRVEDIIIDGLVKGSILHVHRARTVIVRPSGSITASELGCKGGVGKGESVSSGAGGGGGHGGKGGSGIFNDRVSRGGVVYDNGDLPCELGSGGGGSNSSLEQRTAGGGIIVMGSKEHPLWKLDIFGSVKADGESLESETEDRITEMAGGSGGGSGGTLLLFLQTLTLGNNSFLSSAGGHGGRVGGGGGAGGRVHFHWSGIPTGDEYVPIANVNGTIYTRGGNGSDHGISGGNGTVTGKECPKGLFGLFCVECAIGTYKDVNGSDDLFCVPCPPELLPYRAEHIYVRGGVTESFCPYQCISGNYRLPNCYTPLEELINALGGPWLFGLLLSGLLVLLALVLSVARMKFVGSDDFSGPTTPHESQIQHSFPFLESLNEVLETNRAEESQSHVHRMYFMGPNNFGEPWHLPHSPPDQIMQLVYEDAFNRFVDEINSLAAYQWWEGSVYSILSVLAYPFAWSWQQWRRRKKVQRLREFVRSEYDHACLRSCRSRALYEGLKVAATPDLLVAYVDFFLGGDEKRSDLPLRLQQRFPLCIIFGGDGSYMSPYCIHSDNLLTCLIGQVVPATTWYRLVAGLNARLRTVRQGCIRSTLVPVIEWLGTHANPRLSLHGMRVDLGWFQATSSGYYQLGLFVNAPEDVSPPSFLPDMKSNMKSSHNPQQWQGNQLYTPLSLPRRRIGGGISGGIINTFTLQSLDYRKDIFFPLSLILHNTRPIGHQDLVGLLISILLLGDFSLMLLILLQFYSISLGAFFVVLLFLPLALLSPFPAGINALFSHGHRRSAGLARVYALWNVTSLVNVAVALMCAFLHYRFQSSYGGMHRFHSWNASSRDQQIKSVLSFSVEESGWWIFPTVLFICKCVQARLVDWHIANLEVQDRTLYSSDPVEFWES
ncbi:uncharacterized protein LOC131078912 isoform X2 [Cryptomeria japonica]|uniref:uncharacterized protein LOC131078912 isoform X2 n=1 Tax=Cryptomeria japonica TaxID=3369 RepID=UPI0025AD744F|nr:uncharacterized protein LOC131078912 isoform X2 [Cryptomeria japonica]